MAAYFMGGQGGPTSYFGGGGLGGIGDLYGSWNYGLNQGFDTANRLYALQDKAATGQGQVYATNAANYANGSFNQGNHVNNLASLQIQNAMNRSPTGINANDYINGVPTGYVPPLPQQQMVDQQQYNQASMYDPNMFAGSVLQNNPYITYMNQANYGSLGYPYGIINNGGF